jgi:hypothetical protein
MFPTRRSAKVGADIDRDKTILRPRPGTIHGLRHAFGIPNLTAPQPTGVGSTPPLPAAPVHPRRRYNQPDDIVTVTGEIECFKKQSTKPGGNMRTEKRWKKPGSRQHRSKDRSSRRKKTLPIHAAPAQNNTKRKQNKRQLA